jgi:uncharacterized protein (TIGR00369 family)
MVISLRATEKEESMNQPGKDFKSYVKIPKRNDHKCFGCSSANAHGLKMEFYEADKSVYSWLTVPDHLCGWNELVHGGVISTILDEIMSWTAIYITKKFILTKTMTIEFLKPLKMGTKLMVKGSIRDIVSEREATLQGFLFDENEKLFARSEGRYALLGIEVAKRMGVVDDEDVRRFAPIFDR